MKDQLSIRNTSWSVFFQGFMLGIVGLSTFYYVLLFAIAQDSLHPFNQFKLLQPWMSLLIVGFGIQVGLFWLLRKGYHFSLNEKKDA